MPKPVTLPRWATDLTNNDAPSAGQMNTGWTPGQTGVSDYDNYVKYWTYKWIEWIDAGNLGDMTIEKLTVTQSTTYTGIANVSLTANVENLDLGSGSTALTHTIYVTPSASESWYINGLVGGVDGRELQIVNVDAANNFKIRHQGSGATAANRFLFDILNFPIVDEDITIMPGGSITVRYVAGTTNRWRVITTSGCMVYRAINIPASAAMTTGTGAHEGDQILLNVSGSAHYPLRLPPGTIITGYKVYVNKTSGVGVSLGAALISRASNAAIVVVDDATPNAGAAPGYVTISDTFGALRVTVGGTAPTTQYFIRVTPTGGSGDACLHVDVLCYLPV